MLTPCGRRMALSLWLTALPKGWRSRGCGCIRGGFGSPLRSGRVGRRQPVEMATPLQPAQQPERRQTGKRANDKEPDPAGRVGDVASARGKIRTAEGSQCGQQGVLGRGVQGIAAKSRKIGDKN